MGDCLPIYKGDVPTGSWTCGDPTRRLDFFWWLIQQVLGWKAWR